MKFLSICSGIEAASVAWEPLGWRASAFSEIEDFPSAVLAHRYPGVPNLGDMTKYHEWRITPPDLIVGGTPCQAFSVAGLRQGLSDPRGNLTLTFLGLVDRYRPKWVVWENVPGVLSDRTNAFGNLLAGLGQLGYGWAYRVLDAQYFGLAQRRKRVFVVAYLGDWTRAAAVLFEPESLLGNPPPSREPGQKTAPTLASRASAGGGLGTDFDLDGGCIPIQEPGKRTGKSTNDRQHGCGLGGLNDPMFTLQAGAVHGVAHALRAEGFDASEDGTGRGTPIVPVVAPCLKGNQGKNSDAAMEAMSLVTEERRWPLEIAPTLNASFGSKQGLEDQHALNGGGCSSSGDLARCLTTKNQRNDWETETLIPTRQGGFFDDRFLCRNCGNKFGVNDYPRNPTCPKCQCMTVDDLLQGDSFPSGTPLAFAERGSPNNPQPISFHPTQDPISSTDGSIHALGCGSSKGAATGAVAIGFQDDTTPKFSEEIIGTQRADAGGQGPCVQIRMAVRRLTPVECERLQGFPDNYTLIPGKFKKRKPQDWNETINNLMSLGMDRATAIDLANGPDGPRYKALGNSMAVPVMRWIGRRIAAVATPSTIWED